MTARPAPLLAVLVALGIGGCGGAGGDRPGEEALLVLNGPASAVDVGTYLADARGFTEAEGVDLSIEAPDRPTDALRLLRENRAQFAVLDLHDLALAREAGQDLVAVLALLQVPRAAVYAGARVRSPRDLAGARVGVPGRRGDAAVLRAMVRAAGGAANRVRRVTTGDRGARALLAGRVDAITALGTDAGDVARAARPATRRFGVEDFGAPRYPELVLVTPRATIQDSPSLVQATVTALRRGYREALLGPEEAVGVLVDRADGLARAATQAELDDLLPAFDAGGRGVGAFDPAALERWASWEQRFGITRRRPDVARMVAPEFATRGVVSG